MHSCSILAAYSHNNKLTRNIWGFRLCAYVWNSDINYCFQLCWQSTLNMIFNTYDTTSSTNDGILYINMCTRKCCFCFPSNILLRYHIQRQWTNNTRRGTRRESRVTHCGDAGSSSGQGETRQGFSANSLAIPKIIPSLLITHVSLTYQLCYTNLLINNK